MKGGMKEMTNYTVEFYYLLIYLLVAYLTTLSVSYTIHCRISGSSEKYWYGSDVKEICRDFDRGHPVVLIIKL